MSRASSSFTGPAFFATVMQPKWGNACRIQGGRGELLPALTVNAAPRSLVPVTAARRLPVSALDVVTSSPTNTYDASRWVEISQRQRVAH